MGRKKRKPRPTGGQLKSDRDTESIAKKVQDDVDMLLAFAGHEETRTKTIRALLRVEQLRRTVLTTTDESIERQSSGGVAVAANADTRTGDTDTDAGGSGDGTNGGGQRLFETLLELESATSYLRRMCCELDEYLALESDEFHAVVRDFMTRAGTWATANGDCSLALKGVAFERKYRQQVRAERNLLRKTIPHWLDAGLYEDHENSVDSEQLVRQRNWKSFPSSSSWSSPAFGGRSNHRIMANWLHILQKQRPYLISQFKPLLRPSSQNSGHNASAGSRPDEVTATLSRSTEGVRQDMLHQPAQQADIRTQSEDPVSTNTTSETLRAVERFLNESTHRGGVSNTDSSLIVQNHTTFPKRRTKIVLTVGPSGSGKTFLCDEIERRVRRTAKNVNGKLSISCSGVALSHIRFGFIVWIPLASTFCLL